MVKEFGRKGGRSSAGVAPDRDLSSSDSKVASRNTTGSCIASW